MKVPVLFEKVVPPSILYLEVPSPGSNEEGPPDGELIVIVPSFAPLQVTLVEVTVAFNRAGRVIDKLPFSVAEQP